MLDMSWGELLVIGGVALVVIKPKDLPKALRTVGQMTAKIRRLAGEFQSQFSEAMREAELEDVKRDLENINRDVRASTATAFNPIQTIRDEIKTSVEGRPPPPIEDRTIGTQPPATLEVSSPETAVAAISAEHAPSFGAEPSPVSDNLVASNPPVEDAEAPPVAEKTAVVPVPKSPVHPAMPVEIAPLTEPAGPGLEGMPTPGTAPPGETTPRRDATA